MATRTPGRVTRSRVAVEAPGSVAAAPSPAKPNPKSSGQSLWFSPNPSKRWAEVFFLLYSPFWILWALCILVPFQLYEYCDEWGYLTIGLLAALPCVLLPPLLPNAADAGKPWHARFWVKMNIWMFIFGYVGNYFWTHYFFNVLGAAYTMPSHRLNGIPLCMYFMTQAYFCFYHTISNLLLRRVSHAFSGHSTLVRRTAMGVVVFALSYATAFMETLTISHYPYYTFVDKSRMYSIGSLFYAIYFFVSFPMFYRIDEAVGPKAQRWSLSAVCIDSLAAAMLVTLLLDTWRISFGGIVDPTASKAGLAWAA